MVTKDNYTTLEKIGNLLSRYKIDTWKIYQFIPLNTNAIKNRHVLEISNKEFNRAVDGLDVKFSKYFKVLICKMKDRNNAYFFINSDGNVFMPIYGPTVYEDKVIGNIFDNNIFKKWELMVSKNKYRTNAEKTFNINFG